MNQVKLNEVLDKHSKWLKGEDGGERADLTGANLTGANLTGVNLSWADLTRANLTRANLTGTNLTGANLTGANLTGTKFLELHTDIWTVQVHATSVRIGCQHHAHEKWLAFSDEEIASMDRRALGWWKTYRSLVALMIEAVNAQ